MKRFFTSLAIALAVVAGKAQTVYVSTYNGTDISQYAGQLKNVKASRMMFKGWNTMSLPFSMTEQQINEVFGNDCRLEKLSGVYQNGDNIYLNFQDVKKQGIMANTPYIIYYNKDNGMVNINLQAVRMNEGASLISFTTDKGVNVTMNGAQKAVDGANLYGILAVDNSEAKFADVTAVGSKFYATRCFIEVSGTNNAKLVSMHGTTSINGVTADAQQTDSKVYNLAGQRVNKNSQGIKIVNGKKTF